MEDTIYFRGPDYAPFTKISKKGFIEYVYDGFAGRVTVCKKCCGMYISHGNKDGIGLDYEKLIKYLKNIEGGKIFLYQRSSVCDYDEKQKKRDTMMFILDIIMNEDDFTDDFHTRCDKKHVKD